MNWNKWLSWDKEDDKVKSYAASTYTDTLAEAVLAAAQGTLTAESQQSAAVEFGVGLLERCFAMAEVNPESLSRTALTPLVLSRMVRQLLLTGNSLAAVDTASGELLLLPVSGYEVSGGVREASWRYTVQLAGPSSQVSRRLPSTSVVHIRMGSPISQPWRGVSPLINAGVSATLLGRLEQRMAQEANARVGNLLMLPDGTNDETVDALKRDLAAIEGGIAIVESEAGGHGQGVRSAPQIDWGLRRFGANIPESNIGLRQSVALDVIAALGIPAPLYHGTDGVSAREAYRLLLVSTLQPIAELIASELDRKLDRTVEITFRRLQAADIQSRARAFGTMVSSGVDPDTAMEVSGLQS